MQLTTSSRIARQLGLAALLGLGMVLGAASTSQAQELPTGAARVVKKVQIMALTGKSELDYTVGRILENNASMIPHP
ncbi:MAG: hypothetical protein KC442_21740 [Thermomicrobiales bacterium]|nr:hypothetical protein [Thermomicrobiales bacterium]MCA9880439.1 hypothetical protein [Thermomicrobiales bacterium]